jgi:sigma-B regulation protein RsbU (phosphoserine phosphatase)
MDIIAPVNVREQLLDRREKLQAAAATLASSAEVMRLLQEVDAALARVNTGVFGICETCHDPIEADRLRADPLTRFCLDHLSPGEQRALEYDLELTARIQRELLPPLDRQIDGWQYAYHYQPASTVSGDYCDVIAGGAGDTYFLVGDVAGHGIAAAMLMSHLSALVRTLIPLGLPIAELMQRANGTFCESTLSAHYATLVCGRASRLGEIEICIAGHPPAALIRADGVSLLDATALPIGMFCTARFATSTMRLAPGDALLLYTDGLSEAQDQAGSAYGIDRITRVATSSDRTPSRIVEDVVRDVASFRGRAGQQDDLTVFAISRR